tara:strand:+ start:548 stop:1903 length:1356 start_codon:yes stop_codon:yes gene_type:complete
MGKNISKSKLLLAIISLVITFFVWQQGLKDSLNRPSVSNEITQKENEIIELAIPAISENLKTFLISNDPSQEIRNNLKSQDYNYLSERNKLIWLTLGNNDEDFKNEDFDKFTNEKYIEVAAILRKNYFDNSYVPEKYLFNEFKEDKYLYHLLSRKFDFNEIDSISLNSSKIMLAKLIIIKLMPLLTILLGIILLVKGIFQAFFLKKIKWEKYEALNLDLLDMVLLIAGGFVVLGEVFSPLISITLVDLFTKKLSSEISQSLKIFFGYLFMAIPPLFIIFRQIKSIKKEFFLNKDYLQFNFKPILKTLNQGFKGWLMIIPFVLLTSLLMNYIHINQAGSNPLLEIVLNNNNYFAFFLLLITTTILAPIFEEIVFRGVLLPVLARDFGSIIGILISSFIFALAHLSLGEFPPLFVLGIGLGVTRLLSGRLGSSVIMHSLWNGLTFLNLFLLRT